jgi:thiol-disulfide isomerase/thioredoxin
MKLIVSRSSVSAALMMAVALSFTASTCQAADLASAATAPSARTVKDVEQDFTATLQLLHQFLDSPQALSDPAKRVQIAPQAVPLLKRIVSDLTEIVKLDPDTKEQAAPAKVDYLSMLSAFGDADSSQQLASMAASKDESESINGQSGQLQTRWTLANNDVALQTSIADAVEKLDAANPDSDALTQLTGSFSQSAATPELAARLKSLVEKMTSPLAEPLKKDMAELKQLKTNEGKPIVVAGKDLDGKNFTTADWKGKVVLVDFWATWCAPCQAELPGVKKLYGEYHPKGLEIVGVSNDYTIESLKDFVAQDNLPWRELYDPAAAADGQYNKITVGLGIQDLPMMLLIDKKGILRAVDHRPNLEELIPKLLAE